MKPLAIIVAMVLCWNVGQARAHFQVLLPASDVISSGDSKTVHLDILFTHPMEQGPVMEMGRPREFGVLVEGKKRDLLGDLKARKLEGKTAYGCSFTISAPGDYVFYLEPAPYWEAAERKTIVHYTKVVVDVMGAEEGWDAMVGFPVEIEPLVRPYGLWTGNSFRGIVKSEGKVLPFATIEVEYYNEGRRVKIPNGAFTTQVIKADANGVFTYTMPRAGWWGFAALVPGKKRPGPDGKMAETELGGVMWVKTVDMEGGQGNTKGTKGTKEP
jgi:cobalt/nickel transport protein